jgi:hypothetical protein
MARRNTAREPAAEPVALTSASDVVVALRKRYPSPTWAFFECVANGTGSRADRWADALAMGIWPSRGLEIHGIEIKVSRSDLLRELRDPKKAEAVAAYCDYWWIAVGDPKIVKVEELPPAWGLLVPSAKDGMRPLRAAVRTETKTLDRPFVAALLRRAAEVFDVQRIRNEVRREIYTEVSEQVSADIEKQHAYEIENLRKMLEEKAKEAESLRDQLRKITPHYGHHLLADAITLVTNLRGWNGSAQRIEDLLCRFDQDKAMLEESFRRAHRLIEELTTAPKQSTS